MNKFKRVLFVTDYGLDEGNSVADILRKVYGFSLFDESRKSIYREFRGVSLLLRKDSSGYFFQEDFSHELRELKSVSAKLKLLLMKVQRKIFCKLHLEEQWSDKMALRCLKAVVNIESPDLVLFITFHPMPKLGRLGVPHVHILYDPYLGRPGLDRRKTACKEKSIITKSLAYFVPSYCYESYEKQYGRIPKMHKYDLPLLPDADLARRWFSSCPRKEFTYLGQIQSFRNRELFDSFLTRNNVFVHAYLSRRNCGDMSIKNMIWHEAVIGDELYDAVGDSEFLIVLDNNSPFDNYLPSKVLLYVGFTKPIIFFTKNQHSAAREFLKNYPYLCTLRFGDSEIDQKFWIFVESMRQKSKRFDDDLYDKYRQYSPCQLEQKIVNVFQSAAVE